MKMNPWTLSVLLLLAGPLGADPDWHVEYPDSFCVVEGSTTTIPCSFTHPKVNKWTAVVVERVERVVWCPNHPICHRNTPNVYNSSSVRANSRFLYLGDLVRNCTLKIIKTEKRHAATYRFRFDTNGVGYIGQIGVRVNVTNGEVVKVRSSVTDHVVKEGGQVTLTCTSACSFHQLDVHWYRNGHALSETGPALHLSHLTNDETGNYTCSLDSSRQKTSAPWCLLVGEYEDGEVVKVRSSVTDHVVKEGGQVTLTCTSACSFHQLDVHWYRNGHALSETGPALHLIGLTNDDAGDYTCSLDSSGQKTSAPWCLLVGEYEDGEVVKVRSSVTDHVVKEGGQVTLTCTSACSFHQLDVHWYRNGHALSETGPALHLSHLTNDDAGDYTCSLDSSGQNTSAPWCLLVVEDEGFHRSVHLKVGVGKGPLGADPDLHVEYPESFCVVEGSTATIPCSFTHPAGLRVERVIWCPNHPICHLTTPNVYDSSTVRADSRFLYPGDLVSDCTLKIIKTEKRDAATYRFRFVTNGGGYTGRGGLRVKVTDGEDVKVRSSVTDHVVKEGGQVTLTCTSACSFHQLDVHWYRNGHTLSEKGPALHLSNLTNDNAGDYTCSLYSSRQKTSVPWSLVVLEDEGEPLCVH
ncbi:unnamed protein product [Gadus morhua 'NCC']